MWLAVVGSGLAVSGISSSVMPQSAEILLDYYQIKSYKKQWYGSPVSLLFLNLLFHSAIGILSAVLVAIAAKGTIAKFIDFVNSFTRRNN